MSLKEMVRAGESGGRKAAVYNEQLPSQHPLPKPTRDVSASNRSHSLTHEEPPLFPSHRRILLSRETEEADLERQANVVYTKQFRTLAKLLGNQGMEFQELREKVEELVLGDRPVHDPQLIQRIQTLQWELARRAVETRSSQSLPASQEYLRGLETQLGRKSKMITELSDSVKREAFEEAVRGLQLEIQTKNAELKLVEEQAQEARLRTNASLSMLEEELIRHKQTIQKLTFQLDSQKRRAQTASEDVERYRRREKELSLSLESEGKATYQGLSYSAHALVKQLEARDQELSSIVSQQHSLQEDISSLRSQQLQTEELLRQAQYDRQAIQIKLQLEESQRERLLDEIEQVTKELRLSNQVVAEANSTQQALLADKERVETEFRETAQQLRETVHQMRQIQVEVQQLHAERSNWTRKMTEDETIVTNLRICLQQARRQLEESNLSFSQRNQSMQSQVAEWTRAVHFQQEDVMLRQREIERLKGQMALREEDYSRLEGQLARKDADIAHREEDYARIESQYRRMQSQFKLREQEFTIREAAFRQKEQQLMVNDAQHKQMEQELRQSISLKSVQFQQQIQSLRTTISNFEVIHQQQTQRKASHQSKSTMLQQQIQELTQTISHQQSALADRDSQLLTLQQRIEAFQQEKDVLLHRLDTAEQEHALLVEREQHLSEVVRGRVTVEAELSTRQAEIRQLRLLLEQAATKEAQTETEQEQRELHTRELEEEIQRQRIHYQARAGQQDRLLQQLQEQLQFDKQAHERRVEEEMRLREEMQQEVNSLRVAIREMEERHSNELRGHAQLLSRTEQSRMEIEHHYDEQHTRNQQLIQEINQLRTYQHQLTTIIERQNQQAGSSQTRQAQMEKRFQIDLQRLQGEINQLTVIIEQLKHEKAQLERELQAQRSKPKENELSSFSFNHFEAHQQPHPPPHSIDYQAIIIELEQQLDAQKRQLEEQHVRLSYSNTLEGSPLFASLQSDCDHLSAENRRLEELLLSQQGDYTVKEQELGDIMTQVQTLRERLDEEERLMHEQRATIDHLSEQLGQQSASLTVVQQQKNHLEQALRQRVEESEQLHQRYTQQLERSARLQSQINAFHLQLQTIREAKEVQSITIQLQRTKGQLTHATQEILKLQSEISATFKQLQVARREAESQRRQSSILKRKAEEFEHRVSELEQRKKREESDEAHRILSRLSKRSNVSEQELEEARSKGSSDGELSRRILNDPSKISGQQSKFAHHLLVFQNSKIHVMREPTAEIDPQHQIKEQRQQESVLSKQQQQNKTPESSHRQINNQSPTHTHFDRPSNDNSHSRRDAKESQQYFSESPQSRRQSNHSLTSIRQAQDLQQGSMPPQISPVSSVHKEVETKPKEYLPQQSSKKTISNHNQSRQSISNANESRQNIVNNSQAKPVKQEEPKLPLQPPSKEDSQLPSFHRGSYNIPIYIARPSTLQPQERRQSSQSQSGSKTKVRISYGQPSDKSIEIKRREGPREMAGSQVSRVSMQSNKLAEGSINQVSPINNRPSNTRTNPPSLFSSQRREQSRPSVHNPTADQLQPPSDSIINGINQLASRISANPNARASTIQEPRHSQTSQQPRHDHLRRESSPIYIQPRIEIAHSPRHSNFIVSPPGRASNIMTNPMRPQPKKDELTVPPGKIVMRSVIGGKRNSLLNDTATFGKSSGRGPINQTFTQSNDSGIDVVQMEWMGACCKNN